jgi:oleandomycin transport system ATP-binding protein
VGTRDPDRVNGLVSVAVADDSALVMAVSRLDAAGIPVTELSLRLPSLDEVFYALTGHGTASIPTLEGAVA